MIEFPDEWNVRTVYERLHVGAGCDPSLNIAVVHATKRCHQRALSYRGNLNPAHPHYLVRDEGNNLYLNMIDSRTPRFHMALFSSFFGFMERTYERGWDVLIHCDRGESRSASLALLYLARNHIITSSGYADAAWAYRKIDPYYRPGRGIALFLANNWKKLV